MSQPRVCEALAVRHGAGPARLYPCGWRCSLHTPAAMAGRPETPPGPGWPAGSYLTRTTNSPAEQSPSPEDP
ncbi:hypothetical protein [Streptomyces goshikiensis]